MKNAHEGVLILVKLQAENPHGRVLLLVMLQASVTLLHRYFSNFLNYTNGTKSRKVSPQLAIACSKVTIETLEQGVKYVQS